MAESNRLQTLGFTGIAGVLIAVLVALGKVINGGSPESQPARAQDTVTRSEKASFASLLTRYDPRLADETVRRGRVRGLIVTIPDPLDSRGDWEFDAFVEAITRAHETAGYLPDNFYLPWEVDRRHAIAGKQDTLHRAQPGIMLFRKADMPDSVAVVFLVGEVSTTGVQQQALRVALGDLHTLHASAATDTIRIVGPSYSGSVPSLRRVIDEFSSRQRCSLQVRVITGNATNHKNLEAMTGGLLSFSSTVHSDAALDAVEDSMIGQLGFDRRTAEVLEGSTGYSNVGDTLNWTAGPAGRRGRGTRLQLLVPMGIGTLRDMQSALAQPSAPRMPRRGEPDQDISLRDPGHLRETVPVQSMLTRAALQERLNAVIEELKSRRIRVVSLLLTDVRDQMFVADAIGRAVPGIEILIHQNNLILETPQFSRAMMGAVSFSSYPDIAFADRLVDSSADTSVLRMFSSEGAEGIYNAILLQLNLKRAVEGYVGSSGGRRPPIWVTQMGREGPVPFRVVGSDTLDRHYIDSITAQAVAPRAAVSERRWPYDSDRTIAAVVVFIMAGIVGFLPLEGLLPGTRSGKDRRGSTPPPEGIERRKEPRRRGAFLRRSGQFILHPFPRINQNLTEEETKRQKLVGGMLSQWHCYAALRALSLLACVLPIATRIWSGHPEASPSVLVVIIGSPLIVFALWHLTHFIAALPGDITTTRAMLDELTTNRWLWFCEIGARVIVTALGFVTGAALIVLIGSLSRLDGLDRSLFAYRTGDLDSGLSPLVPIGLGGLALTFWCSWHLKRILVCMKSMPAELWSLSAWDGYLAAAEDPGLDRRMRRSFAEVRRRLILLAQSKTGGLLLILLLGFGALIYAYVHPSLEIFALQDVALVPRLLRVLYGGLLGACLICVIWGAYRLYSLWRALRRVLGHVAERRDLVRTLARQLPVPLRSMVPVSLVRGISLGQLDRLIEREDSLLVMAAKKISFSSTPAANQYPNLKVASAMLEGSSLALTPESGLGESQSAQRFALLFDAAEEEWSGRTQSMAGPPGSMSVQMTAPALSADIQRYVAIHLVRFVAWVLELSRRLATFLLLTLLASMLMLASHPAFRTTLLQLAFLGALFCTLGVMFQMLVDMSRNEVLSNIRGDTAGSITWDLGFIGNLLALGIVPLLWFMGAVFPDITDGLLGWLSPILHGLGGG